MATAVSNRGKVLDYVTEVTFNTDPGVGYVQARVEGEPTVGQPSEIGVPVNTLMSNPYDGEAPITTSQFVDDALTATVILRTPTTPGEDPTHVTFFKAGGYQVASSDDTTINDATPTTTEFDLADVTNVLTGEGGHVALSGGKYFPFLSADTTAGTVTTSMALPEAPADAAVILGADTISPGTPGPVATTLTMRHWNQMKASGGSNFTYHLLTGAAVASAGPLRIERGTLPTVPFTFRAAQLSRGNAAALPANSFQDAEGIQVWDDTLFGFATSSAAGGIAAAYYSVISAEISFGVESTVVPEAAGSADQGGICAHMAKPTDDYPRLTVEIKADEARLDDWETAGGLYKYLSVCQYGTADIPGTGVFMPSARLIEQPTFEPYGQDYEKVTLVYRLYPAGYDGTAASAQGNQPFYIVGPSDRA
jgi:hypothetical protein